VDLLLLGDSSPRELQDRLKIPSNLMAHHLKVLQDQGMISRSRSEGDRRRTYLRLLPDALAGLLPRTAAGREEGRVVFVCTANTARSQLAAALWRRSSPVPVTSAGTHPAQHLHPGALAAARRHGLPMRPRRPRPIHEVVATDDMLVTVCDRAHEELSAIETIHWSVSDPVPMGTDAAFDTALEELAERIAALTPIVTRRADDHG
jgi:protein-tyrosine-phosphatase